MYRAGSIFCGNAGCVDSDDYVDYMQNAGNFGETTPVDKQKPTRAFGSNKPKPSERPKGYNVEDLLPDQSPIGIPSSVPGANGEEIDRPFNEQVPTLPGPASAPFGAPTTSAFGSTSLENRLNSESGLNITVEELRRLDPSVTDVRILNVEDRAR